MVNNIMLIDDDPDELLIFREAVDSIKASIHLQMIRTVEEFDRAVNLQQPDLIFLDINMHLLDGFAWLDLLRLKGHDIPIVMYSNSCGKNDINRSYQGGATIYLVKPVNFLVLIRDLEALFSMDFRDPGWVRQEYYKDGKGKVFESST